MADYSLGGGFSSGYGSGGLGLGGGYDGGGNTNSGGLGLGGGNYGGGWNGSYNLGDGYSNSGGSGSGANWGEAVSGGYWDSVGNSPLYWDSPASPSTYSSPTYNANAYSPTFSPSRIDYSPVSAYAGPGLEAAQGPQPWGGEVGLTMEGSKAMTGLGLDGDSQDEENGFMRGLKRLGLFAVRQNPTGSKALGLLGAGQDIARGAYGSGIGTLTSMATGNGLIGGLAGMGINAAQGKPVGTGMAGSVGSGLGGAFGSLAGPLGAFAGSELGGWLGRGIAEGKGTPTGLTPSQRTMTEGNGQGPLTPYVQQAIDGAAAKTKENNYGDKVAAGVTHLAGLYGLNKMQSGNKEQQAALAAQQAANQASIQQMLSQSQGAPVRAPHMRNPNLNAVAAKLDGMFSANSSAGQQLRQTLDRKDAAAGRRSQYGPREVQLLSELTRLRAQAEPAYMNAEIGAANAYNQGQMGIYQTQSQERNAQLQRYMAAQQLGMSNNNSNLSNQFKLQDDSNARQMQQLATLYGLGKETGAFNWLGSLFQ